MKATNNTTTTNDNVTLLLYRGQFKDVEAFEQMLVAMGKDVTENSLVISINK